MSATKLRLVVGGQARVRRAPKRVSVAPGITRVQVNWLRRGLDQPGGKLPLFDEFGQSIHPRTVTRCIEAGWAEPWFANPIKPDWRVCKLTDAGRRQLSPK